MLRRGAAPLRRRCALDEHRREEWDTGIGASSPKASDASRADRAPRARVRTPRHPVLALANLEVATGRVIAPSIGPSRTNEDFASHVAQTIATDPDAGWIFVVDQLNPSTNRKRWSSWLQRSWASNWSWTGRET